MPMPVDMAEAVTLQLQEEVVTWHRKASMEAASKDTAARRTRHHHQWEATEADNMDRMWMPIRYADKEWWRFGVCGLFP